MVTAKIHKKKKKKKEEEEDQEIKGGEVKLELPYAEAVSDVWYNTQMVQHTSGNRHTYDQLRLNYL